MASDPVVSGQQPDSGDNHATNQAREALASSGRDHQQLSHLPGDTATREMDPRGARDKDGVSQGKAATHIVALGAGILMGRFLAHKSLLTTGLVLVFPAVGLVALQRRSSRLKGRPVEDTTIQDRSILQLESIAEEQPPEEQSPEEQSPEEQLSELSLEVERLSEATRLLTAEKERLAGELQGAQSDSERLRQQLLAANNELARVRGELGSKTSEMSSLQRQISTYREQLQYIQQQQRRAVALAPPVGDEYDYDYD